MRKGKKSSQRSFAETFQASWKIIRLQFFIPFPFFISFAEIVSRDYLVSYGNFISDCWWVVVIWQSVVERIARYRVAALSNYPIRGARGIVRNFAIASTGVYTRACTSPGGRGGRGEGLKHARREKPTGNNHRDESQGASVSNSSGHIAGVAAKGAAHRLRRRCLRLFVIRKSLVCIQSADAYFMTTSPRCDSPIIRVTRTLARGRQIIP